MIRRIAIIGILCLSGLLSIISIASAFANPSFSINGMNGGRPNIRQSNTHNSIIISQLRAGANNSNNNNNDDNMSDLTSTLARLDQQFNIQQRSQKSKSRWSRLILPNDPDQQVTEETAGEDTDTTTTSSSNAQDTSEYVWILEPPSRSIPSCVIVFTGGAGLGQFPHIAYNELLSRISDRLNAVCIAAPYQVGLDHFGLAKQTGERLRRALIYCEDDPARQYPSTIPTYSLSHSLGCKLQTIYMAATQQQFDGIAYMSFNNFSFGKTVSMAKLFADQIRKNTNMGSGGSGSGSGGFGAMFENNEEMLNNIFAFAENIIGAIGVDFSPNAPDTERLIQMRFDDVLQRKTRLFVFDEDNLDNSKEFMDNCSGGPGPSTAGLPGGHLAPVYFKLGVDDLDLGEDVPPEAFEVAQEAMGGFRSASFGDEEALNGLVDEVCNFILGKPPARGPEWESAARNEPPKLLGYSEEDDSSEK